MLHSRRALLASLLDRQLLAFCDGGENLVLILSQLCLNHLLGRQDCSLGGKSYMSNLNVPCRCNGTGSPGKSLKSWT